MANYAGPHRSLTGKRTTGFRHVGLGTGSLLTHQGDPQGGVTSLVARGTAAPTFARSGTRRVRRYVSGAYGYYDVADGVVPVGIDANGNYLIDCENSSSNIARHSGNLSSWDGFGVASIDSNNALHPTSKEGYNFDGLIADSGNTLHRASYTCASTPTGTNRYVYQIEVKAGNKGWCMLRIYTVTLGAKECWFDLGTGAKGSGAASSDYGIFPLGGGKYLCWVSPQVNIPAEILYYYVYPAPSDSNVAFAGDGTTVNLWAKHAMVEIGSYPSSFIGPTTTAAVVRNADVFTYKADDGNIGGVGSDKRGTLRLKIVADDITLGSARTLFAINDGGSSADEILLTVAATTGYVTATFTASGGTVRTVTGPNIDVLDGAAGGHVVQLSYEAGRAILWVDGTAGTTSTAVTAADIPDDLDKMQYGYFPIADERFWNPPRWVYVAS